MARREGWLEGVAVIREAADQGEPWPSEIPLNVIGSRKCDFALEVTLADELYPVRGRFKVPKKAENVGFFSIGNKIPAGRGCGARQPHPRAVRDPGAARGRPRPHGPGDAAAARARLDS